MQCVVHCVLTVLCDYNIIGTFVTELCELQWHCVVQ